MRDEVVRRKGLCSLAVKRPTMHTFICVMPDISSTGSDMSCVLQVLGRSEVG